jgi:tRNA (adenine37-N6)-methyltransferase
MIESKLTINKYAGRNIVNNDWQTPVTIRPIGVVVSGFKNFDQVWNYTEEESSIRLREDLTEGLLGLEHFSHLSVIYHQHRREEWKKRLNIPEGKEILTMPVIGEPTCVGIYTSRNPARPSGIGSCVVEIIGRERNLLHVRGLDAVDGTPVLDIEVYIPRHDSFPSAEAPLHWCQKTEMLTTSRLLHWDTMNVALTLGMRAGQRAMHELGVARGDSKRAVVHGGSFFGQGVEAVTGCSVMHGTMNFVDKAKARADWLVIMEANGRSVEVKVKDQLYAGADEVLLLKDDHLFTSVINQNASARG